MYSVASLVTISNLLANCVKKFNPGIFKREFPRWLAAWKGRKENAGKPDRDFKGPTKYSDLEGLPCILILCEKGKMGTSSSSIGLR